MPLICKIIGYRIIFSRIDRFIGYNRLIDYNYILSVIAASSAALSNAEEQRLERPFSGRALIEAHSNSTANDYRADSILRSALGSALDFISQRGIVGMQGSDAGSKN